MSVKTFIDTNILVYAHDVDQNQRHQTAREILIELMSNRNGALSPQVLQEFYVTVTRKLAKPLSKRAAREIVEDYSVWCIDTTAAEVATAFRIEDEAKISFWDALICAAALKSGASILLSEDLNSGQQIAGLRIHNPFM
jgi:predicted nucleic acid-binding protein